MSRNKKCLSKTQKYLKFDYSLASYTNITNELYFLFPGNQYCCIKDKKCKFYYEILKNKKFVKPCHTYKLKLELQIVEPYFSNIYTVKIIKAFDKNISDFNYRMLKYLLNNRNYLSKWKDISNMCPYCKDCVETNKHLLYECQQNFEV